ncbi:hypothetical protein E4Z66_17675 [Aliishimia ponticola]|uniref:Flagellar FliJ protein n=1 Tax=Aliishimia ponticola TaxID=2499833 RepID=A0A4S4N6M9_9RHOB|nr:hypothetical protein [Aliishimia ponticola]THH34792.1 hypothetical protein E4Z66_17675 [Aliishimia ponticola]
MSDELRTLLQLEKIRSTKSQKALMDLQVEENRLRGQIETLKEHRRQSHTTDTALMPMRAIGALVQWQAWIDRTQGELNIDLAKVMARKAPVLRKVRIDSGRRDVVASLADRSDMEAREEARSQQLQTVLDQAAVRAALTK